MTISQIRALGERLRGKGALRPGDLDLLQQLRADYDAPLQFAETVLRERLGISATSRLKTVQTLIEKLVREKTRLSVMQDIAGLRVVDELTLQQQDVLVRRIEAAFDRATVEDRRFKPSFGYRAEHIIVEVDDCLVEIQVRTRLQDLWAQTMESLADRWGRQIRYGLPPDEGSVGTKMDAPKTDTPTPTRIEVVDLLIEISQNVARVEEMDAHEEEVTELRSDLHSLLVKFAALIGHL